MSATTITRDERTAELVDQLRDRITEDREHALRAALTHTETLSRMGLAEDERARLEGELEFSLARTEQLDRRLSALPSIEVTSEADLYRRAGPHSFFADLAASASGVQDAAAARAVERLRAHSEYEASRVAMAGRLARAALPVLGVQSRDAAPGVQSRALSAQVPSAAGVFVPPQWMTEAWVSVARSVSALKGLVTVADLPPDCLAVYVPRFDSSAGIVPLAQENVSPPDQYAATDSVEAPVCTFAGEVLASQQLADRAPGLSDETILADMAAAYAEALGQQLMTGTGTNGQLLGLLNLPGETDNVPGIQTVTYTSSTPTAQAIVQATAQAAALVSDTRLRPPSAVLMRGSRWFWLAGEPDGSGNVSENRLGTGTAAKSDVGPVGPLAGLPVFLDNSIPNDLGTGADQDAIVTVRARDILLLEDPVGPRLIAQPGTSSAGQMTVVFGWHTYVAALTSRYPSGVGVVTGTGLATPSGW